jgi:diguanylate cyclase (GGDEF)-like protein
MKEVLVKTLMTEDVMCLPPGAPLQQAVSQMIDNSYSCMLVKEDNIPIGIITERDLVAVLHGKNQPLEMSLPVSNFMTSPVMSLNQNESLFDAMVMSRAERLRHLPVVNDKDRLVGLVTQSDIADAHFHIMEKQAEMIEQSIAAKTADLQKINDELQALSMEDHLMEVGNRRAMEVDLNHTHASALRYKLAYSILLIDVDYFKLYNDHYGHQKGDEALKILADLLKKNIRAADRLYRYGGEELLLVLPHTDASQAEFPANKLVSEIAAESIPHDKSPNQFLTISCGGACAIENGQMLNRWEDVVEMADRSLYQAKQGGRNQAVISQLEVALSKSL